MQELDHLPDGYSPDDLLPLHEEGKRLRLDEPVGLADGVNQIGTVFPVFTDADGECVQIPVPVTGEPPLLIQFLTADDRVAAEVEFTPRQDSTRGRIRYNLCSDPCTLYLKDADKG